MTSGEALQPQAEVPTPKARVFINYRREDTPSDAWLLYYQLASKFGPESIFLDANIRLGMNWQQEINSHIDSCHVFLALIGPRWIPIIRDRRLDANFQQAEDHVQSEIQRALRPNSGITVIPVLIRNKAPLTAKEVPESLRALAQLQAAYVRQETLDQDVKSLIARIEEIACEQPAISPDREAKSNPGRLPLVPIPFGRRGTVPPPDEAHYKDVLGHMVKEGDLVPFLGSRMSAGRHGAVDGSSPGDADQLAAALAKRFGLEQAGLDLPEIAQHVYATAGGPDLYRVLRDFLTDNCEPGQVHRFLARFPRTLEELGLEKRYQLIVSTNFDTALEQAFDNEAEPYDLVIYMASGPDKGKFMHVPAEGSAQAIIRPNSYTGLPIDLDGELKRTVIVKILGTVDGNDGDYRWKDNYVITEDDYIGYLSRGPILVPVQILSKLRESHCLFLGYAVRDWSLRVFLKRIWEGSITVSSWAISPDPDILEKALWAQSNASLYRADLGEYVGLLHERLNGRAAGGAGP